MKDKQKKEIKKVKKSYDFFLLDSSGKESNISSNVFCANVLILRLPSPVQSQSNVGRKMNPKIHSIYSPLINLIIAFLAPNLVVYLCFGTNVPIAV